MYYTFHKTPIGKILIAGSESVIKLMSFPKGDRQIPVGENWSESELPFIQAMTQLDEYFQGSRIEFNLPIAPSGTEFQQLVYKALLEIRYGQTISYGELARQIGRPRACRAVGAANGANPIPIIIPCHRVIGSTGKLTGFGGGIPVKRWLLAHEKKYSPADDPLQAQSAFKF